MTLSYQEIQAIMGRCLNDIFKHDPELPYDFLAWVDRESVCKHATFDTRHADSGEVVLYFNIGTTFYALAYMVGVRAEHLDTLLRVTRGIGETRTRLYSKEG